MMKPCALDNVFFNIIPLSDVDVVILYVQNGLEWGDCQGLRRSWHSIGKCISFVVFAFCMSEIPGKSKS